MAIWEYRFTAPQGDALEHISTDLSRSDAESFLESDGTAPVLTFRDERGDPHDLAVRWNTETEEQEVVQRGRTIGPFTIGKKQRRYVAYTTLLQGEDTSLEALARMLPRLAYIDLHSAHEVRSARLHCTLQYKTLSVATIVEDVFRSTVKKVNPLLSCAVTIPQRGSPQYAEGELSAPHVLSVLVQGPVDSVLGLYQRLERSPWFVSALRHARLNGSQEPYRQRGGSA